MKKTETIALTLGLAGALSMNALAVTPVVTNPRDYVGALVVNGAELDTTGIPYAPSYDMIPLRLVAEADHGSASWDQETNSSRFYLEDHVLTVNFATGGMDVDGTTAEGKAQVRNGITFVPAATLNSIEGYAVDTHPELDVNRITITTPNNDPMIQLLYQLAETAGVGFSMKSSAAELEEVQILTAGTVTRGAALLPMMTSPDTVLLCRAASGKLDQLQADLQKYRKNQEDTFSWYLSENLPKVQNAQIAIRGDWVFFVIAENAEAAVEQFRSATLPAT